MAINTKKQHLIFFMTNNLKYKIFVNALKHAGLNDSKYQLKKIKIDELVDNRNEIAHGKYIPITPDYYFEMLKIIIDLMVLISDDIIEAALSENYLLHT